MKFCVSPESAIVTPKEAVAIALMEKMNAHESVMSYYHPRAEVLFQDAKMTISEFVAEEESIVASFPDLKFVTIQAPKEQKDGTVVSSAYAHATHTGAPYGFGPYPAIESKGVYCRNDPE